MMGVWPAGQMQRNQVRLGKKLIERQVHDLVLSHGSPAPRHLRTLLGI